LKTFVTEEENQLLYEIQQQMLNGGPVASKIDSKLNELEKKR